MSGPLRPQDPAEEFLLEQQMVLLPPHRPVWPSQPGAERSAAPAPFPLRKAPGTYVPAVSVSSRADGAVEDPAALVPTRLSAKERKLSRSSRRPEQVASGSSRMSLSRSPELNRVSLDHEAGPSCHANVVDLHRRVPSPEETDEWRLRKRLAREQKVDAEVIEGNKRRKLSNDATIKDDSDDDDEDGGEWCVICLQSIRDPTIFECINVWANQSRKCPLCTAPMSAFLLHELDSKTGPSKFFLPPLPTVRPSALSTSTFASSLPHRPHVAPFRGRTGPDFRLADRHQHTPMNGDIWAQVQAERRRPGGLSEEDALERAIERRKALYAAGLFAKHIASNTFTRFKPTPTPRQFAESPDMIARVTAFLRRELRVWRNVDVEFLTTYIVSLMRSIDIRSEPAVRLLADFLDSPGCQGRERKGAEHFAHEVYSFLRSPYRDLALYDAVAQYDPLPAGDDGPAAEEEEETDMLEELAHRGGGTSTQISDAARPDRQASIGLDDREDDVIDLRSVASASESLSDVDDGHRRRSFSRSLSPASSFDSFDSRNDDDDGRRRRRSQSPRPPPLLCRTHPRRWNEADTYIPKQNTVSRRGGDSWIDPDELPNDRRRVRSHQRRRDDGRQQSRRGKTRDEARDLVSSTDATIKKPVHKGLRGWDEVEEEEEEEDDKVDELSARPTDRGRSSSSHATRGGNAAAPRRMSIRGVGSRRNDNDNDSRPIDSPLEKDEDEYDDDQPLIGTTWSHHNNNDEDPAPLVPLPTTTTTTTFAITATSDKAREAVLALRDKRAERREKLLKKLTREKRASKKDMNLARRQSQSIETKVSSSPLVKTTTTHGHESSKAADAIASKQKVTTATTTQEAEDKAKAKLLLKLRLAKEKKKQQQEQQEQQHETQTSPALVAEAKQRPQKASSPPSVVGSIASTESDRASILKAKLLAMKERKKKKLPQTLQQQQGQDGGS